MTGEILFDCYECGEAVRMTPGGPGEYEYRPGIRLAIPTDVALPTCEGCGEMYLDDDGTERLSRAMRPVYAEYCRGLVVAICAQAGVTRRELAQFVDVDPTYISHFVSGTKRPSLTLVRFLQVLARHPQEVLGCLGWRLLVPTDEIPEPIEAAPAEHGLPMSDPVSPVQHCVIVFPVAARPAPTSTWGDGSAPVAGLVIAA